MEVRAGAMERWRRDLDQALEPMVWEAACDSWYKNAQGRVVNNWPRPTTVYRRLTRAPRPGAFLFPPS